MSVDFMKTLKQIRQSDEKNAELSKYKALREAVAEALMWSGSSQILSANGRAEIALNTLADRYREITGLDIEVYT